MQILYIWVKRYGNFYEQEFNLNSKFRFSYGENQLICKLNEKYVKNFFNNLENKNLVIKEVTAIVGNNGAGKTTVLDLIMNLDKLNNTDYIIVTLDENKEFIITTNLNELNLFKLDGYNVKKLNNIKDIIKPNCIYHSSMLDHKYIKVDKSYTKDISTTNLVINGEDSQKDINKNSKNVIKDIEIFYNDFKMQVDFISNFEGRDNFIDFNLPDLLHIKTIGNKDYRDLIQKNAIDKYNDMYFDEIMFEIPIDRNDSRIKNKSISEYMIKELNKVVHNFKKIKLKFIEEEKLELSGYSLNSFKFIIAEGILFNFLIDKVARIEDSEENLLQMIKLIEMLTLNSTKVDYDANYFVDYVTEIISIYGEKHNHLINIDLLSQVTSMKILPILYQCDRINGIIEYIIGTKNIDSIKNIYDIYRNSVGLVEYLNFSWKMSSGEYNMLSLYSRLYWLIDKNTNKIKFNEYKTEDNFITVLLDEADMSFHPEWQRKYVYKLLNFFDKVYINHKLHIIFTTHSPILLSDIPNENVIYLKREENETAVISSNNKTFGANIYNLYNDNFFFNSHNSFGIIGEFATNKIVNIIKNIDLYCKTFNEESDLNYGTKLLKQCKDIIYITGEEYINIILNQKYRNLEKLLKFKSGDTVDIDDYKNCFNSMSPEEKKEFIKYIVENYKG
ncbi:hypothetical protein D4A35_03075 [Paraclostridium bifermentans]|uniref:Uncharacterized protein n=1 Tax=Paraclostridium bifermentans TaxID=1490 RepID=A0A5P3XCS4_PARBF|nr:AAA family ATPase [Paraclostridium bifermentans]QEZ67964.1 hypothetical protein D4A35_03075 [Paraclostridium bifermentans]